MFGLLMIFGQIRGEPWYGNNSGVIQGLTTGPHHVKLAGSDFLSVPRPIAAQIERRAALDLVDKPQRACRRHDQTERVGADDALPLTALILPQSIEGVGVANFNFHRPAVAILGKMSWALNVRSVVKKASMAGGGFLCPGRVVAGLLSRRSTTTRTRRPGNTECHSPHQACISAPASLGCGDQPWEVCTRVFGEPIRSPFLRGAPRRFVVGVGGNV